MGNGAPAFNDTEIAFAYWCNFRQNARALCNGYTGDEWQKMIILKWKVR